MFVRNTYLFVCVINEDVPDSYQCLGQIIIFFMAQMIRIGTLIYIEK